MFYNKKNIKYFLILALSLLSVISAVNIASFGAEGASKTIVFFYTGWDAKSSEIKPSLEKVAGSYSGVNLTKIDVDSPNATDQARALGLSLPRSVPEIVVITRKGNVIFAKTYGRVSEVQLKSDLDQVIAR